MTRQEMIEKLSKLEVGSKIVRNGKVYEVRWISRRNTALAITYLDLLEEGKPETYEMPGIGLAAGKMFTCSNRSRHTWYAQQPYMDWEFAA